MKPYRSMVKASWDTALMATEDPLVCLAIVACCLACLSMGEVGGTTWLYSGTVIFLARRYVVENRTANAAQRRR